MRLRPWRVLMLLLMLAAVFPPPRVMNRLIVDSLRSESGEARKPLQARGRNRIDSQVQLETFRTVAPLSGGAARPPRTSRFLAHRLEPIPKPSAPTSSSPFDRVNLYLRC